MFNEGIAKGLYKILQTFQGQQYSALSTKALHYFFKSFCKGWFAASGRLNQLMIAFNECMGRGGEALEE